MPRSDIVNKLVDGVLVALSEEEIDEIVACREKSEAEFIVTSWARFRTERTAKLTESDWTQYNDSPLSSDEVKASWAIYRQELRDLPATTDDPVNPTWPEAPE